MSKSIIAFGDIHGCPLAAQGAVLLTQQLDAIAIFLGDYVDRGTDSMGVLRVLMAAQAAHPEWVFLRGNHDQMLLDLIHGSVHPKGWDERTREEAYAEWLAEPEDFRSDVITFLQNTLLFHTTSHFVFVHAPLIDDGRALHDKHSNDLVWNYDLEPRWGGLPFVHGHIPIETAEILPHRINVNTSCGYGGSLTGVFIDSINGQVLCTCSISEGGRILIPPDL